MHRFCHILFLTPVAIALSGCAAAIAVPVVAGGAIARSNTRGGEKPARPRAETAKRTPPTPAAIHRAAALPALPANPADVRPGQLYIGQLPSGRPAAQAEPLPAAPTMPAAATSVAASEPPKQPVELGWSDVGHHVAGDLSPEHSVLLARGSDTADPHWVACGGKPPALLAAASTVLSLAQGSARTIGPTALSWLEALRVLGAKTVVVASAPEEGAAVTAAFGKAGLPALVEGDTLILASAAGPMPGIRAEIGARYCILALVGRSGADFPNGLTPATTPPTLSALWGHGWFLLPNRAE